MWKELANVNQLYRTIYTYGRLYERYARNLIVAEIEIEIERLLYYSNLAAFNSTELAQISLCEKNIQCTHAYAPCISVY